MVSVTLVFALLGFLSPSNRGSLATVMIVCWTLFGGCDQALICMELMRITDGVIESVATSPHDSTPHWAVLSVARTPF